MPKRRPRIRQRSATCDDLTVAARFAHALATGSGAATQSETLPALVASQLQAARCALWLVDDDRSVLLLTGRPYGFTAEQEARLARVVALSEHSLIEQAMRDGQIPSIAGRRLQALRAVLQVPDGALAPVPSAHGPLGLCFLAPTCGRPSGRRLHALLSIVVAQLGLLIERERGDQRAANATYLSAQAARLALVQRTAHALAAATSVAALCDVLANTLAVSMGYRIVTVYLIEGDALRLAAYRASASRLTDDVLSIPLGVGIVGRVWATNEPYLCRDALADPYFRRLPGVTGIRSEVAIPLHIGGAIAGVLNVESEDAHAFSEDDVATLSAVADQAGIALQNMRLYEAEAELRRRAETRARRLEHIQRVGERLKMDLDEREVGMRVVLAAREALGFRMAVLNLFDRPGDPTSRARVVSMIGIPPEGEAALLDHDFSLASVRDLFRPEFLLSRSYFLPEESREVVVGENEVTWWSPTLENGGENAWRGGDDLLVPLTDPHGGHLLGFLSVADPEHGRRPEREDVEVLEIFVDQAVVALRNAQLLAHARRQAERDSVTGLLNHRAANARLAATLGVALQRGEPLSLVAIDIDHFKLINDTYGHLTGDQALRHVARLIQQCVREHDPVARLGGDEFLVILLGISWDQTLEVVQRLIALVQETPLAIEGTGAVPLRLSAGVATFPDDATQPHALFAVADARLYEAKRSGGRTMDLGARRGHHDDLDLDGFDMLNALVATVDNKDRYTSEHSEQVATYACALADALGLSPESQRTLRMAGLLHDVGKIGVPDRVLRKPGPLNADEWEAMKQHVTLSITLLRTVGLDTEVLTAVMHHHERWDGTGYPQGLAGAEVPLLGRIMILADAASAMALDRPYRAGLTIETIIAELRAQAGSQFDPALVEPFIAVLHRLHADRCGEVA